MARISVKKSTLAVCIFFIAIAATPIEEDTPASKIAVCVNRISGTYGSFSRWLYYASLLTGTLTRRNEWLAAGIIATALIYSSVAIVHACVILSNLGSNPEILDLDILPVTTITASTIFLYGAIMEYSQTLQGSMARHIMYIWSVLVWIGSIICTAATWNLKFGAIRGRSSEAACFGTDPAGAAVMLSSQLQLDSRFLEFNCTYQCFHSTRSWLREGEDILVVKHDDIYSAVLGYLPIFALAAVIFGYVITGTRYLCGRSLHERASNAGQRDPYFLYKAVWRMLRHTYPSLELVDTAFHNAAEKLRRIHNTTPGWILPFRTAAANSDVVRYQIWFSERLVRPILLFFMVAAGVVTIIIGEVIILRRHALLKDENYTAIGQWGAVVAVGFVVLISLLDKHVLQPAREYYEAHPELQEFRSRL